MSDVRSAKSVDVSGEVSKAFTLINGRFIDVCAYVQGLFGCNLHAKRVLSLGFAVIGLLFGGNLSISGIAQGLAKARSLCPKHTTKQIDRFMSNPGINPWSLFHLWVPHVIGSRGRIFVAMDWTEFDKDDQSTLMLSLVLKGGKSIPLIWMTFWKFELKDRRNEIEDCLLNRLKVCLPKSVNKVIILADRGFGDSKLYKFLQDIGFGFVIRFRGDITVTSATGESRLGAKWVRFLGKARKLVDATVTQDHQRVPAVVCVHDKGMKETWCLATSERDADAQDIINYYAMRWSIETGFRDTKDLRFGMGLSAISIREPERRDRLLLIAAITTLLLTTLGAASEETGMNRKIRANTKHTTRMHSWFTQGRILFDLIHTMRDEWFLPLMRKFEQLLFGETIFSETLQTQGPYI
jgi:hypothetical protein